MKTVTRTLALALAAAASSPALAQTINVDFSADPAFAPPASYGAAGLAGTWNSLRGDHGVTYFNLLDIHGNVTNVRLKQIGGFQTLHEDDPATTGADDALLDDFLVTYSATLESCLFFDGLENGEYEVILYAWMPTRPDITAYTSVDEEPGFPHLIVGGAWTGAHQEFVTHSRHIANVTNGRIGAHSGIVPGENPADGAPLSGAQIRKIVPCPADLDGDGAVGASDLASMLGAWGPGAGSPADLNNDGSVNAGDLALMLGAWGPCA